MPGGQNHDLSCLQPIDIVGADFVDSDNIGAAHPRASSRKELRFEEYPPRRSKRDRCITYRLTDGKQINVDGSRVSRPLGFVMEFSRGKWVARVGNLSSLPLPLGAAKKTAIELYRSKDRGEPRDWIAELNKIAAREVDRREPMPTFAEVVAIERANFPPLTMPPRPEALQGDDYPIEYYEDGYPVMPECLRRAPVHTGKEEAAR